MRVKVICAVLVYGEGTYHKGDYVEVENGAERQMLIQERCVVESPSRREIDTFRGSGKKRKQMTKI